MIQTSMLDIASCGELGSQCHGLDHAGLNKLLGPPSDWGTRKTAYRADIWSYGDIEFHFSSGRVFQIFSDHNDLTWGGDSFRIDAWVVRRALGRREFELALIEASIPFDTIVPNYDLNQQIIKTHSGALFTFLEDSEDSASGFVAWSLQARAEQGGGGNSASLRDLH